jgi:DNA (cytosine-5)-methyltransferase 1
VRVLDLFCGAGGASMGYYQRFSCLPLFSLYITGVDNKNQRRYPFKFVRDDALLFLEKYGKEYDFIHASPPCQHYSVTRSLHNNTHPDYIAELRDLLKQTKVPYAIENVPGAPLENPTMLCGAMFDLKVYRHRLFETSFPVVQPEHEKHKARAASMGRGPKESEFMTVVGHFSGVERAKEAMGIDWMIRDELAQAIPPAYTRYIGEQFLNS